MTWLDSIDNRGFSLSLTQTKSLGKCEINEKQTKVEINHERWEFIIPKLFYFFFVYDLRKNSAYTKFKNDMEEKFRLFYDQQRGFP